MNIRPFEPRDEDIVIDLWQRCGLIAPQNNPRADIQRKLAVAPELESAREAIHALRKQEPEDPTTLVMTERPPANPRPTFFHRRGEFLLVRRAKAIQ